jgi:hypothetical protein
VRGKRARPDLLVGVHHRRQGDLPEVVRTLDPVRLLAGAVQAGQQDRDQQRDDPDDDEQLDEREAGRALGGMLCPPGEMQLHTKLLSVAPPVRSKWVTAIGRKAARNAPLGVCRELTNRMDGMSADSARRRLGVSGAGVTCCGMEIVPATAADTLLVEIVTNTASTETSTQRGVRPEAFSPQEGEGWPVLRLGVESIRERHRTLRPAGLNNSAR